MRRVVAAAGRVPAPLLALAAAAVVVLTVGARWMVPWVTRDAPTRVSTPVPPARAVLTTVAVKPRQRVCVVNVTIPAGTGAALLSGSVPRAGAIPPPFTVVAQGPGYLARSTIPRGWPQGLVVHIAGPKTDVVGRFCLRNVGRTTALLNANNEPGATGKATSTLAGRPTPTTVALELDAATPQSRLSRAGTLLRRAADLSWRPLGEGFGWLLSVLVVLVTVGGAAGALAWSMRRDDLP